jgi:hypothetical protein
MSEDLTWVALKDVHKQYGMTLGAARNAIAAGRFPVETYKLGKLIVIDKEVHARFFREKRESGLRALDNNKTEY